MKSKAVLLGHPLHPMLIPFPVAFLAGAVVSDAIGWLRDLPSWWTAGSYLSSAGIVTALLAATPGLVDYVYTVPPESSAKTRATKHMLANLTAVALFVSAWAARGDAELAPGIAVLALEGIGVGLLTVGGWMGGVLVNRNQIGVDHRYARAGKWKEAKVESASDQPVMVARADELEVDQMKLLHVGGRRVVLSRREDGYVAFDDRCPHRGGSLAGGVMIGGLVQCPWHGSQFDCRTGAVAAGPAEDPIATYPVTESGGKVLLTLASGDRVRRATPRV
jgi:nitrite reductase/ring-hydroxylating ferredoxin subunit/uncharacterized membrane protein